MLNDKGFDLWANGYDKSVQVVEENDEYPFAGYKEVLNSVYKKVREKMGTVLDIGFGTGVLTKKLYDENYLITGIDFSERMIEIAKKKMPKAELIQDDFTRGLPHMLKNRFYDWIISTYAIHHLTYEQKKSFIHELLSHLDPNGFIILGDVTFQTREDLMQTRQRYFEQWDDEEVYLVVEEIEELFSSCDVKFQKISHCSGVIFIKNNASLFDGKER